MKLDRRSLLAAAGALPALPVLAQTSSTSPPPPSRPHPYAPRLPVNPGLPPMAVMDVWPGGRPPGAGRVAAWRGPAPPPRPELHGDIRGYARPVLAVWRPEQADGTSLLVLPGGGYHFVSWDNEGASVARVLLPGGPTVFVLAYRLPADRLGWPDEAQAPLQDAQRAIRLVRADAEAHGRDPRATGVLGFSAGGHLAGRVMTEFDRATYAPVDAADRHSARPQYAGLLYPVITLEAPYAHTGSRQALIGEDMGRAPALSVQRNVRAGDPAAFVAQCLDDDTVDPDNSLILDAALRRAGVPTELHLFQEGGHGFGVSLPPELPAQLWPELFTRWRRRMQSA
ncbi:MAG: alpha/beta hydrolase [Caulobacteraceae bacterium]|nr:alpha/beta hydrolase [Caulobacter sp.]